MSTIKIGVMEIEERLGWHKIITADARRSAVKPVPLPPLPAPSELSLG